MDEISIERDGPVVRVTLNRPDKLNAQTPAMWLHLAEEGARLCDDTTIRAVVVAGTGRSFSAGIDITNFTANAGGDDNRDGGSIVGADPVAGVRALQAGFEWLEQAPFLTIARVQGHAFGAGMQLALACDVRVCADDVQMGLLELNWGLMPDLGGTVWLPRLIGPTAALEHMLRGDKWRADDLLRLGIANQVVARDDLDSAIDEYLQLACSRPPLAIRGAKRAIREGWGRSTEEGMEAAARAQLDCLRSRDFGEAAAAFMEGRTPNFSGS